MKVRISYTYELVLSPEDLARIRPVLESAGYTVEPPVKEGD